LVRATLAPDLPQFRDKAFGARLVAYPLLMLLVPVLWAALRRRGASGRDASRRDADRLRADHVAVPRRRHRQHLRPLRLDRLVGRRQPPGELVPAVHGRGRAVARSGAGPPWAIGVAVAGIGALLAIGWELAEWFFFIRHGTEINTAYEDTLGDEGLGGLGGALAGVLVGLLQRHRRRR